MEILFFLAVATVLIIWWFNGNLFACVFLSIIPGGAAGVGFLVAIFASNGEDRVSAAWCALAGAIALGIIWLPRYVRLQRLTS